MNDIIRKAVELADGWRISADRLGVFYDESNQFSWFVEDDVPQFIKDALAAQLVRQVDTLTSIWVDLDMYGTAKLWEWNGKRKSRIEKANDEDRTMNTIKTIVESKVLENES